MGGLQQLKKTVLKRQGSIGVVDMDSSQKPKQTGDYHGSTTQTKLELIPQPSDHPDDPLNWPALKKNLHFISLLVTVGTIGTLKTLLVTVNSVVATELNVSYGAAVALTGLPIMIGAGFGMKSKILAQRIGKRGIQILSAVVMLLAAVWNMHVVGSYIEFMAARIFQGIGWGMFEALMVESITDVFFKHEMTTRLAIYNAISLLFTWGSPILGGYLSQQAASFRNEIMILNIIQSLGIVFIVFLVPESTFYRSSLTSDSSSPNRTGFKAYLYTLKPINAHSTRKFEKSRVMMPLRALCTPSALVKTILISPLLASAYGAASSLSLLFSAMPTFLFPSHLGYIFIAPLILSLLTFSVSTLLSKRSPSLALSSVILGLVISVVGLLSFGLYTESQLSASEGSQTTIFSDSGSDGLSLKVVSALFGLLVAGAVALESSADIYTQYPSLSSPSSASSSYLEIAAASKFLQELFIGIGVMAFPVWVQGKEMGMDMDTQSALWMGLRETSIAIGVLGLVLGSTVLAIFWTKADVIRRLDAKVLGADGSEIRYGNDEDMEMDDLKMKHGKTEGKEEIYVV